MIISILIQLGAKSVSTLRNSFNVSGTHRPAFYCVKIEVPRLARKGELVGLLFNRAVTMSRPDEARTGESE